jgi:transposase
MAEDPVRDFFLRPACVAQRRYEALRCVFLDGCSQKQAAQRFGYSYAAFRQLVHDFRRCCQAGEPPPLLPPNAEGGRPAGRRRPPASP